MVLGSLRVDEVVAANFLLPLQGSVHAAVALFQAGRVPRHVEVEDVRAVALQVHALASGVGGQQNTHRILLRRPVERALNLLALAVGHSAVEFHQAQIAVGRAVEGGAQDGGEIAFGVRVLGEDDDSPVGPPRRHASASRPTKLDCRALVVANPVEKCQHLGAGRAAVLFRQAGHAFEQGACVGAGGRKCAGEQEHLRVRALVRGRLVLAVFAVVRSWARRGRLVRMGANALGVNGQSAGERLDAGEQPLLQIGNHQAATAVLLFQQG